jgi:hypothetical protein
MAENDSSCPQEDQSSLLQASPRQATHGGKRQIMGELKSGHQALGKGNRNKDESYIVCESVYGNFI